MIDSSSREAAGAWAVVGMLALAPACGDSDSPGGGGSAASSGSAGTTGGAGTTSGAGTTTSTAASVGNGGSSSASTGAGEGGGEGGEGGGGGFASTCAPPPRRIAAGDDFTCALAADGSGACRGGSFGEGWLPITVAGDPSPAHCLDAVVAQGAVACVHVVADEACPEEGFYCVSDPLDGWLPFDGLDDAVWLAVTDDDVCGIDAEGASDCVGPSAPPDLGESGPLGGISAGPHDACAWSDAGIVCWGDTPSLAADVPEFPGCVGDIDVGPGFACVTYTGFDIVDCWGELPRDISPRVFMPAPGADVAVGDSFMCALTSAGILKCWGDNARGALGVEGLDASVSGVEPQWPEAEPDPVAIAAGSAHVALLTTDGAVLAWGANDASQICACEATVMTPTDAGYPEP